MVILVATLCDRLTKVATPLAAVAVSVPCKGPLPAARAAVTTVLLSLLRKLPNASSTRTTGCWAKTTPAVAVAEGCLWSVKWSAAAVDSRQVGRALEFAAAGAAGRRYYRAVVPAAQVPIGVLHPHHRLRCKEHTRNRSRRRLRRNG